MMEDLRVLVVDDMGSARKMLSRMLLRLGLHRVEAVASGEEALEYLGACGADLVISDLHMPDIDGLELARRIRADRALRHIQFVLATGQDSGTHHSECHALNVATVLIKPFRMDLLLECVSDASRRCRAAAAPPQVGAAARRPELGA